MNSESQIQLRETALITGAASGIGYELMQIFAQNKYNLVLVDRNQQKLSEMAEELPKKFGILVKVIVKDLSIPFAAKEIFAELNESLTKIDVLVNNAGFGNYGLFNETDLNAELEMMQVNMVCTTHLTKLFLKGMVERGKGKILNVASTAAFQPGPLMAVYFATKAYIFSFSQAIANELEGTGITVTVLCPGPTASAFHHRTGMSDSKLLKTKNMMDARTVAEIGYRGLMTNKATVIPGLQNQILAEVVRFIPRNLLTKIVRTTQEVKD
ncbi:SDR family oxidoreductase [Rivularia sp. UHCC 0363]|uniref:SDR family NAD(P)-dependent oxidoreductase n=1 Tax=Rivularia sp. UHCC 0363 TaxID=3110244 RepID=UPI002B1F1CA9|nr:SDR family oxidoreductase [Rivularia sp. UHCC 0363]MEA5596928.1 SDR family oxidoreductase [Rivularia sp. UHCC 0363]